MPKRDRFADAALGLVAGIAIALLLLVWAVPEFRYPADNQKRQENTQQNESGKQKPALAAGFWSDYATPQDTYAQWIMATFSILATGASIWAVLLLKDTLAATRETVKTSEQNLTLAGKAFDWQLRPYLSMEVGLEEKAQGSDFAITVKNVGRSPAEEVDISIGFSADKPPINTDSHLFFYAFHDDPEVCRVARILPDVSIIVPIPMRGTIINDTFLQGNFIAFVIIADYMWVNSLGQRQSAREEIRVATDIDSLARNEFFVDARSSKQRGEDQARKYVRQSSTT